MGKRSRYLVQEWIYRYGGCLERARDVILNNKTDAERLKRTSIGLEIGDDKKLKMTVVSTVAIDNLVKEMTEEEK